VAGTVVFIEAASGDGGDPGATVSKVFDGSTVSGWVSSASVGTNTDNFLTGSSSVSDKVSNSTVTGYGLGAGVVGEPWDFSSGGTDEGNHIFMIINAAGTRDSQTNGGYGIIAADDLGTDSFGTWYVGPQPNSQGGWEYYVIDPEQDFDAVTAGSATWTLAGNPAQLSGVDGIGVRWKITNTVMGASDNAYVQTGSIGVGYRITGTDAVFSEISTYENTNRFGALETKSGTLFPLCKIRVGTPSGAGNTTFIDTGFNVTWQGQVLSDGTSKATAVGFYGFFADQGSGTTDITLSGGSFAAFAPEEFDLALAGVNSVTFTNVSADRARIVTLDSAVDWTGGTVKNSGQITATDAIFNGIDVLTSTVAAGSGAVLWNSSSDPDGNLDDGVYTQGTASHSAIEFGTAVTGDITLRNCDFSGFNASDDVNGAVFKFLATGGNLNLNLVGCSHDGSGFTVDDTAGVTVTVVVDPVATKITVEDSAGSFIQNARVFLETSDNGGGSGFPYQAATSSLTQAAGTATLTASAVHGLATGDKVVVRGANEQPFNSVVTITVTSTTVFTYSIDSGTTSPAGGTPVFSYVPIQGLTDVNGQITSSKTWPASQGLNGWVRKGTSAPYFKETTLSVADASGGTDLLVALQPDD
jgi:hypothetical protein